MTAPARSHPQAGNGGSISPNDVPWCFHPNGPQQQPVYGVEAVDSSAAGGRAGTRATAENLNVK